MKTTLGTLSPSVEQRNIDFLRESSALDGFAAVNFALPQNRVPKVGYFGALKSTRDFAIQKTVLTVDEVIQFHKLIVGELKDHKAKRIKDSPANVELIAQLKPIIEKMGTALKSLPTPPTIASLVEIMSDLLFDVSTVHPFAVANGCIARLLANFPCLWFNCPLVVFYQSEESLLSSSLNNINTTRVFIANKLKEAVYHDGEIMMAHNKGRVASASSLVYHNSAGTKKIVVEWHELEKRKQDWQAP